jgi:hypothetical protein
LFTFFLLDAFKQSKCLKDLNRKNCDELDLLNNEIESLVTENESLINERLSVNIELLDRKDQMRLRKNLIVQIKKHIRKYIPTKSSDRGRLQQLQQQVLGEDFKKIIEALFALDEAIHSDLVKNLQLLDEKPDQFNMLIVEIDNRIKEQINIFKLFKKRLVVFTISSTAILGCLSLQGLYLENKQSNDIKDYLAKVLSTPKCNT